MPPTLPSTITEAGAGHSAARHEEFSIREGAIDLVFRLEPKALSTSLPAAVPTRGAKPGSRMAPAFPALALACSLEEKSEQLRHIFVEFPAVRPAVRSARPPTRSRGQRRQDPEFRERWTRQSMTCRPER